MVRRYWMLCASLPHLPHPDQATRLPIGAQRLQTRWRLLDPVDRVRLEAVLALLAWRMPRDDHADALAFGSGLRHFMADEADPRVRELVGALAERRCLVAALRARAAQAPLPEAAQWAWGRAQLAWHRHRDHPDFRLGHRHPWLPRAQALLRAGDALALEKMLLGLDWHDCERVRRRDPRSFAGLLAYALQWDGLQRWLSRDARAARNTFAQWIEIVRTDRPSPEAA